MIARDAVTLEGSRVVNGLLQVNSRSEDAEEYEAERGNAFILHYECKLKAVASGGLLYIKNLDPNFNIHITRIYIDPFALTDTDLRITQWFNPVVSGGEDVTATSIIQKNTSSGNLFDLQMLVSSASTALTFTGGTRYHSFPVASRLSTQRDMNGTNIISLNKGILWGFKTESGAVATANETISLSINITKVPR